MIPSLDREPEHAVCCWKPFSGDFRISRDGMSKARHKVLDPIAKFGRGVVNIVASPYYHYSDQGPDTGYAAGKKQISESSQSVALAAILSAFAVDSFKPGYEASPASPSVPVVGEQSTAISALQAPSESSTSYLSGTELEAAAGPMTVTEGFGEAAAGESSSIFSGTTAKAALSGATSATLSKLLTKAVDTVINPLFAPPSGAPTGGGGGGGGDAGGYPFQEASIAPGGGNMQLYLVAAALAALLLTAAKKQQGR